MKNYVLPIALVLASAFSSPTIAAQDVVILRSGEELKGKIIQVSQNEVKMESKKGSVFSKPFTSSINPSDIYLIKYKERGNLYFKEDGKRVSGEKQKLDSSADIVYLCEGKEIQAWDLKHNSETITFRTTKDQKKASSSTLTVANGAVFMIKYSDGSCDVITDITLYKTPEVVPSEKKEDNEPQIKVVFYTVKAGDTLTKIAEEFNVSIDELREWNDISTSTKDNAKLKVGIQYIIQQKITK